MKFTTLALTNLYEIYLKMYLYFKFSSKRDVKERCTENIFI